MKGYLYVKGLILFAIGGIGLTDTSGNEAFPIWAILFGIGFILMAWSYVEENRR